MGKTVKVRVFVAVDSDGRYGASGWNGATFGDVIDGATCSLNGGPENQFWLTAELPIPNSGDNAPEVAVEGVDAHALGVNPEDQ